MSLIASSLSPFSLLSTSVPTVLAPVPLPDRPPHWSPCLRSLSLHPAVMPMTLKHKPHRVPSTFAMISCLIFSLASGLAVFWALVSTFPAPPLPNVPRSHLRVSLHVRFPLSLLRPLLCGTLPCRSSGSQPQMFPSIVTLVLLSQGPVSTVWDPEGGDSVFCNIIFSVWHVVSIISPHK